MYSNIYYSWTQVTYFPVRKTKLQELHLFPNVFYGTEPRSKLMGRKLHIQRRFSTCHCWLKAAPQRGNVCSRGSLKAIVVPKGIFIKKILPCQLFWRFMFFKGSGTETSWWGQSRPWYLFLRVGMWITKGKPGIPSSRSLRELRGISPLPPNALNQGHWAFSEKVG